MMGRAMKLKPIDAFYIPSKIQSQVIVFYKSIYKSSCFAMLSVTLDQVGGH